MSEGSNKRIRVEVWLPESFVHRLDKAAKSTDLTRASFLRMAISAYLRKWQAPSTNDNLHEPCSVCGKRHDRNEHFGT